MKHLCLALLACLAPACATDDLELGEETQATTGSGTASKLLGSGIYSGDIHLDRDLGDWDLKLKTKGDTRVAVQTIDFAAGGQSGWHSHPGPVFITVVKGTMTFYDSHDPTCTPIVRTAGQGFLDGGGEDAHIARNETGEPAQNLVVYLAPTTGPLRIDAPNPGTCAF